MTSHDTLHSTPRHGSAHAKINLFLHVTGRRSDGYHLLDSLAVFAGAADRLALAGPGKTQSLTIDGPFGAGLHADENNLVLRAARLLGDTTSRDASFAFALEKNLPVASGIGGGSADAACALRLVAAEWGVGTSTLLDVAGKLGADVPVCVAQRAARMEGIGEILSPVAPLPPVGMLLVNPGIGVSTPAIFRTFAQQGGITPRARLTLPDTWPHADALFDALRETTNDLQRPAISHAPVIADVIAAIGAQPGCAIARMSGSGATCFGLFPTPAAAIAAREALARDGARQGWWSWAGALHNDPQQ